MTFTGKDLPKSDFIRLTHKPFNDNTFAWDERILEEVLSGPNVIVQTKDGFCNMTEMVRHFKKTAEFWHSRCLDIRED